MSRRRVRGRHRRADLDLKLVLVNYEYPPLGGGAGNATANIARALAAQQHEVRVVTSGFGELPGRSDEAANLRVIRLDVRRKHADRSNYPEKLSYVLAAARALPRLLRAEPADGLIVFFSLPCGPLGWLVRSRCGTPYVISLRGGDVPGSNASVSTLHNLLAPLRRAVLRNAVAVTAVSPGLGRLSEQADRVPFRFISNGVDTDYFTPAARSGDTASVVRYLFAGRFQTPKNLFMLLDCFAAAVRQARAPLELVLAGDGPQRPALEAHVRKLGVSDRVTWKGWLDKPALREAYRGADVFLNPSLSEGMPNTVLEAMACGLPVIASRITGNEDLVSDGITGILFDLARPSDLVAAITALADDASRRTSMGAHARAMVCERYTWDATAAQYAALFSRI